jgi:hypothetical protein
MGGSGENSFDGEGMTAAMCVAVNTRLCTHKHK